MLTRVSPSAFSFSTSRMRYLSSSGQTRQSTSPSSRARKLGRTDELLRFQASVDPGLADNLGSECETCKSKKLVSQRTRSGCSESKTHTKGTSPSSGSWERRERSPGSLCRSTCIRAWRVPVRTHRVSDPFERSSQAEHTLNSGEFLSSPKPVEITRRGFSETPATRLFLKTIAGRQ